MTCKKEELLPTFAQPKLSIKTNAKLRKKISKIIVETEIGNKHRIKNEIKADIARSIYFEFL